MPATMHRTIAALFLVIAFLVIAAFPTIAQDGPDLPCVNCPEFQVDSTREVPPETGIWRNPEQPGSGFMFEVQNNRLAGYYFLYDDAGRPVWHLFVGELQPSDDPGIRWVVEAELQYAENGACLNCAYQQPDYSVTGHSIRFEFIYNGFARFSVDGAPMQTIMPLVFGTSGGPAFAPQVPDYVLPNLEGQWSFAVLGYPMPLYDSVGLYMGRITGSSVPPDTVRYTLYNAGGILGLPDLIRHHGTLDCMVSDTQGPICKAVFEEHNPPVYLKERTFYIRPGDITDSRITGVDEDGLILEAYRLEYEQPH